MTVALRPYRPADHDIVRRWIDGPVIAQVRHSPPVFPLRVFGLGITILDPVDRRKGYGREAQRADQLFRERGARRVQAETDPQNVAERRALVASGFTRDDWEE